MVNAALSIGALVGVAYSAGFVIWEVGRYAAPQVPRSRFDERKEMFAYTAGLFVGIPLVFPLLLLFNAFQNFALFGIATFLIVLIALTELSQWLLLRSRYFGTDGAGPFYAIGLRAGIGGLLTLALVAQYFSLPSFSAVGIAEVLAICGAIVLLEVLGAIVALPPRGAPAGRRGGPISAVPLQAVGFFFLAFAAALGTETGLVAGLLVAAGALLLYRRTEPEALEGVAVTPLTPEGPTGEPTGRSPFGRTDR